MAIRGDSGKWRCRVGPIFSWILLTGILDVCWSCHSNSVHLHACLHRFLERDFPMIQAYQAPPDVRHRGHVLLEGPTLDTICQKIEELDFCLEDEAIMCRGLYSLDGYLRMMRGFRAVEHHFCREDKTGLMGFLKYGSCVENFRSMLPDCRDMNLSWETVWINIIRLQVGPEICPKLEKQRNCVVDNWQRSPCDDEARNFYNQTFNIWLDQWCNRGTTSASSSLMLMSFCVVALFFYLSSK